MQDGAENADVRRIEYHKRLPLSTTGIFTEYHRNSKIMCCVLLTSNAMRGFIWNCKCNHTNIFDRKARKELVMLFLYS